MCPRHQHLPALYIFLLTLSLTCGTLAKAQDVPQSCLSQNHPVQSDVSAISAALGICPQMSLLTNTPIYAQMTTESSFRLVKALSEARDSLANSSREIDRANLVATLYAADVAKRTANTEDALKVSGIIIGGIGAGVGGSLHLVNNPSVGHAGTVLGIAAGVTGAGINLAAFFVGKSSKTEEAPKQMLEQYVQRYAYATEGQNLNLESFRKNPSSLSRLLLAMDKELTAAQNDVRQAQIQLDLNAQNTKK
jgi:hypothetical protein